MLNPMGLYNFFGFLFGLYAHHVLYTQIFIMYFKCIECFPWAIGTQKRKIAKKIIFFGCQKWGLYTRGLHIRHYSINLYTYGRRSHTFQTKENGHSGFFKLLLLLKGVIHGTSQYGTEFESPASPLNCYLYSPMGLPKY